MSRQTRAETTLTSDFGEQVHYETTIFGSSDGLRLLPRVTRVFVGPVAQAFEALNMSQAAEAIQTEAMSASSADGAAEAAQGAFMKSILSGSLDMGKLGDSLILLANALDQEGGPQLVKDLLKHTQRQETGGKLIYVTASDMEFDRTYQGNYGELAAALWWVIKVNFGPVLGRVPFVGGG
ncbi:MAG: phage tail assembly chaperone [Myxococcota bacterium]